MEFASKARLREHPADHLREYHGFTKDGYVNRAEQLLNSEIGGQILGFTGHDGRVYRYDMAHNDFAVADREGYILTLFKPVDGYRFWKRAVKRYGQP